MNNPTNLQECLDILIKSFEQGGWDEFKTMDEEKAIAMCHHTTGRAMRNDWKLWDENSKIHNWFKKRGIWHADDMSSIILRSFHRKINGKKIDLEGQIKYFKDYWEKGQDEALFEVFSQSDPQSENPSVESPPKINELPAICRETMYVDISEQVRITLFPEKNGQPAVDVIRLDLKQVEGTTTTLYMTPCEAMEIVSGLSSAVQFYFYNQEQYRKEVLEPRLEISKERQK